MRTLYCTRYVPEQATILMIDPDNYFIEEAIDMMEPAEAEIVRSNLYGHASEIVRYLTALKASGHRIVTTPAKAYWKGFEALVDDVLPAWEVEGEEGLALHASYYDFAEGKQLIVGGMWREICVFEVSHRLQEKFASNVRLCNSDLLTISYQETYVAPEDDMFNLNQACVEYDLAMQLCG